MYGGGLSWNNGVLSVGEDKYKYEQPELEAFHLLEENENTIRPGEMTLNYWRRFKESDVHPNNAAAFTTALGKAYLKRLKNDKKGDAFHRTYTALLGKALDRLGTIQYKDQFAADGKMVVDGDKVTHDVKVAYDKMLDGLNEQKLLATLHRRWEPEPNAPGWKRTAQGWRPKVRGWDDVEPQVPPAPTGWEPEPRAEAAEQRPRAEAAEPEPRAEERRRLPVFRELSQREAAEQRRGGRKHSNKRSRRRSRRKRTRHL